MAINGRPGVGTVITLQPSTSRPSLRDMSIAYTGDVTRPNVDLVVGSRQKFSDETADLLRQRLKAFGIVVAVILVASMVGTFVQGIFDFWYIRFGVLITMGVCLARLFSQRPLTLRSLRWIEAILFSMVVGQVTLMIGSRLDRFADSGDVVSLVATKYLSWSAWCLVILIYGIFIPNTWKRGAAIMLPIAFIPYIALAIQSAWSTNLAMLLADQANLAPIPVPVVAALVGVYGTHIINSARREAFKSRQFGQYRLLEKLGSGGMGEVYKAEHMLLKRPCAMKLIRPGNELNRNATARFETEVKATAKLTHFNTIDVYDYGHTEDGTFYYVMELLPGLSLDALVQRYGPLSPGRVVHLLRQVCGALHEAHSIGLIHRDIKPANIFAAQRGGVFDVAKLLDFGLVKEQTGAADQNTESGRATFSGTPLYMSPEQASAYENVDARADLYSLGAVGYFLLTGKPPFSHADVASLLAAHAISRVTAPSSIDPSIPNDLEQVILRCLEKKPANRFANAEGLNAALAQCGCVSLWDDDMAKSWWDEHFRPTPKPVQRSIDLVQVTVDLIPDETIDG